MAMIRALELKASYAYSKPAVGVQHEITGTIQLVNPYAGEGT